MGRFVEEQDRRQDFLLPASLDDYVAEDNPVRVVEAFIDALDLVAIGFAGATPAHTGRPAYHPSTMLKIYLYGYLNRIQSSRRLEREAQRNIELMWLTGRLAPEGRREGRVIHDRSLLSPTARILPSARFYTASVARCRSGIEVGRSPGHGYWPLS
jgi:transposase